VRANDWLQLDVFSGSVRVNKRIGGFKMKAMDWIEEPASRDGTQHLLLTLYVKGMCGV